MDGVAPPDPLRDRQHHQRHPPLGGHIGGGEQRLVGAGAGVLGEQGSLQWGRPRHSAPRRLSIGPLALVHVVQHMADHRSSNLRELPPPGSARAPASRPCRQIGEPGFGIGQTWSLCHAALSATVHAENREFGLHSERWRGAFAEWIAVSNTSLEAITVACYHGRLNYQSWRLLQSTLCS